jgi:hypothetical protein
VVGAGACGAQGMDQLLEYGEGLDVPPELLDLLSDAFDDDG